MKKLWWLVALLAALALVINGCSHEPKKTSEKNGTGEKEATGVYFAKDNGSNADFTKYQDADKPFIIPDDDFYVRIMFDPPGEIFNKLRVYFSLSSAKAVVEQCIFELVDGKPVYRGSHDGLGTMDKFEWEKNPTGIFSGLVDKKNITGICFHVENGGGVTFTLNELKFIGTAEEKEPPVIPPPYSIEGGIIKIDLADDETMDATVKGTGWQQVKDSAITVAWNPNGDPDGFRCEIEIAEEDQEDLSEYSSFTMEWKIDNETSSEGSFNISLYFDGKSWPLSKKVSNGSAEFDFTKNKPDWATGDWVAPSIGTITGFEIYSNDPDFEDGTLIITKLGFVKDDS